MTDEVVREHPAPIPGGPSFSRTIGSTDLALLFARLGTAGFLIFQSHDNVLSQGRMEEFAGFLAGHGYPFPSAIAPLVVWVQILMALLLIAGFLVRAVGLVLMAMFIVALMTVHIEQPFNFWWPALALVQFGAIFAAAGGGRVGVSHQYGS